MVFNVSACPAATGATRAGAQKMLLLLGPLLAAGSTNISQRITGGSSGSNNTVSVRLPDGRTARVGGYRGGANTSILPVLLSLSLSP